MKDISAIGQEDITSIPTSLVSWESLHMGAAEEERRKSLFRERLDDLVETSGKSARAISLAIGANASYVAQLINGKGGIPSAARLRAIAEQLGTTTDYLTGLVDSPVQPVSEVSFRDVQSGWRGASDDRIKVLGTGYCADLHAADDAGHEIEIEQLMLEADHVVHLINRPPALWNSPDAYAIYFHGSSMEPRFFQGEIGIVDPRRPPGPGDFVVVQLNDGQSDGVVTVLVKQLVRASSAWIELHQYNPDLTFRIPRGKVARLHRICNPNELYGN